MQDYKNNKILELKKEMVKVPNQTDYEINGIDTSRALFFYRKEKEKFKVIPRGSYTITEVASNKYLRITDSSLLSEALEFQVCYLFVKSSSSYVDPFPELERLQEHYNELYSDFDNLLQQLQSNNIVGDTMKMAYVLPQLDEGQVWVLRQGEMKAENIFDLDARLQEAFESFTRVFDNWIQTQKKPEFTQFVNSEKDRVLQAINQKETESIENIDSHTTNKIAEIEAEGLAQKNLVTAEGTKQVGLVTAEGNNQVQRVTETGNTKISEITQEGNNQVANVTNAGETEYNKIIATGIDAKQDKVDNRLTTPTKEVVPAINLKLNANGDNTYTGILNIDGIIKNKSVEILDLGRTDVSFFKSKVHSFVGGQGDSYLVSNCYFDGNVWKKTNPSAPASLIGTSNTRRSPYCKYADTSQDINDGQVFGLLSADRKILWEGSSGGTGTTIQLSESLNNFEFFILYLTPVVGSQSENTPLLFQTYTCYRSDSTIVDDGSTVVVQYATRFVRINIRNDGNSIYIAELPPGATEQLRIKRIAGGGRIN